MTIPATEFKAHCLELMDRVRRTGVSITITKRGKPVALMIPQPQERRPLFGSLPVTIIGNIVDPIAAAWDAD
ncbi:MAG: type II toxin-antitoxin system Phd/YefM family antitoxin [Candidatus Velthaea sp.]